MPGGIVTFGGGVPLYQSGQVIGGLGVSGDSSCADHAIAFRMRKLADLDGTPAGPNGSGDGADNIIYPPSPSQYLWATANPRLLAAALLGKRSHTLADRDNPIGMRNRRRRK